jgi:ubiquitin-protein ligase E3 A
MNPDSDGVGPLFFHQFIVGCDCVGCDNRFCRRCPDFVLASQSPSELSAYARRIARNPDERPLLCPDIPHTLTHPDSLAALSDFHSFALHYLDSAPTPITAVIPHLRSLFTDANLFPLMLLSNPNPLSPRNPAMDDSLLSAFSAKLSSAPLLNACLLDSLHIAVRGQLPRDSTFTTIRGLLLSLYFPALLAPQCIEPLLLPLFAKLTRLPRPAREAAVGWLSRLPRLLRQFIGAAHAALCHYYATAARPSARCEAVRDRLLALRFCHDANAEADDQLPTAAFCNHHVDESVDLEDELRAEEASQVCVIQIAPFVLSLETKAKLCQLESQRLMGAVAFHMLVLDVVHRHRALGRDMFLTLHIRRSHLLDDAVTQLSAHAQNQLSFLKKLRVVFEGESAVDVGGPSREFFYLVSERLFSPDLGMFVIANGRYNWFAPHSFEGERSYFLVGAVVGLAIHNGVVLPVRFPPVVYKRLLTPIAPLTLGDLSDVDSQLAAGLRSVGDMLERGEDVGQLELTFDAVVDVFGERRLLPLMDGMTGIAVDNYNAKAYITSYINFILVKLIEKRFDAFRQGFALVTHVKTVKLLDPCEMDIMVSGEEVMDWDSLKRTARYTDGYTRHSRSVKWFWEIFTGFSPAERLLFLKFATGTDRSPLGGLANVRLVVQRGADPNRLPVAHTCFNTLTLPDYRTKGTMKSRILRAIRETEGFGIV